MGLRIRTNVSSLIAQRNVGQNNRDLQDSMEKLSSGYRINNSKDDAAGLAISENLRARIRGLGQARRNANDAVSMVQIAEGGMQEMSNMLVRMRELTVQAASDTVGDKERGFLNKEYSQLAQELQRTANVTEFNGNKFFTQTEGKDLTEYVIQVGVNGTAPSENRDTLSMNLESLRFNFEDMGIGVGDQIGAEDGSEVGREKIAEKLGNVDTVLNKLASERANIGALQSRLESSVTSISTAIEAESSANSRIRDVDYASESARAAQARIMNQSSIAVLSQANQIPDQALALLRS